MSPLALIAIGVGLVLVYAAYRNRSPIELVQTTLSGGKS